MRLKYSRLAKLVGLVLLFVFVIPLFFNNFDKQALRSSADLERQIDLAFKNEGKHIEDLKNGIKVEDINNNNNEQGVFDTFKN